MGSAEAASIGKRIREVRRSRGMTQVQLAEAAGISASHMGDIETGRSSFSVEVLQKICRALHVSADSILLTAMWEHLEGPSPLRIRQSQIKIMPLLPLPSR